MVYNSIWRGKSRRQISTFVGIRSPEKGGCWGLRPRQPVGNTPFVAGDRLGNLPSCIKPEPAPMYIESMDRAEVESLLVELDLSLLDENNSPEKDTIDHFTAVFSARYKLTSAIEKDDERIARESEKAAVK